MFKDYPLIKDRKNSISQFYPHIPKNSLKVLKKVFAGRWVGQGPLVDKVEKIFSTKFLSISKFVYTCWTSSSSSSISRKFSTDLVFSLSNVILFIGNHSMPDEMSP